MARTRKSVKAGPKRSVKSLQAKAVDERKGKSVRGGSKKNTRLYDSLCTGTHIRDVTL
jgi:hypothetical protein